MRAFLMTRGRTRDYAFVGHGPASEWWSSARAFTSFEQPTMLVESSSAGWRVYLSAIPSARRDRVNTRIRYTLVLESEGRDEEAPAPVAAAIGVWLEEVAAGASSPSATLSAALDAAFPEEVLDALASEPASRIEAALGDTLAALAPDGDLVAAPESATADDGASAWWLGSARSASTRAALGVRARALLAGELRGKALVVNLGAPEDMRALGGDAATAAVALLGLDPSWDARGPVAHGKKKASETSGPPRRAQDELSPSSSQLQRSSGPLSVGPRRPSARQLIIGLALVVVNLAAAALLSRSW